MRLGTSKGAHRKGITEIDMKKVVLNKSKIAKPKKLDAEKVKERAEHNRAVKRANFIRQYLAIATHHLRLRYASDAIKHQFTEIDSAMNALRRHGVVTTELVDRLAGIAEAFMSMLDRLNLLCMKQRKDAVAGHVIDKSIDVKNPHEEVSDDEAKQ